MATDDFLSSSELATQRQLALDAARMGWWHYDPITKVSSWDQRYKEIFGVSDNTQPNEQIMRRLHPEDLPGVWAHVEAALNPVDPKPFSTEYRICLDDGSIRWIEAHGVATFDGQGSNRQAVSFVGTVADITDRKLAEEAIRQHAGLLRTSEERLAFAIEAAELGTFYCPMPLGEIVWNAKCKEHFWLPPDAAIDFDLFYSILHPDDRERTRQAVEKAVFSHQPYDIQYRTIAPDGRFRWLRAKGRAYYAEDGAPTRFDGVTLDVTEQKRIEAELRESETRFRQLADAMPQLVWVAAANAQVEYYNTQWYAYTGLPPGDISEAGWRAVLHPDDVDRVGSHFQRTAGTGGIFESEFRLRRATDGMYRWFLCRALPIVDEQGRILRWFGTNTDIDDLKRLETQSDRLVRLLENERSKLAAVVEQAPALICTLGGPDHVFELANDPYLEIIGQRQIIGRRAADVLLPEAQNASFREILDHVYRTGQTFAVNEMPLIVASDNGGPTRTRYVNFVYQALRNVEGDVSGILVHGVDISDMVRARHALRDSEQRWELAVTAASDGIWDYDLINQTLYWSPRCKEMLGYTDRELPASLPMFRAIIHPDDAPTTAERLAGHTAQQQTSFVTEYRLRHKNGTYRWIMARGMVLRDETGQPKRLIGSHTDITERKALDESLRQSESRLKLAIDTLGLALWDIDLVSQSVQESDRFVAMLGLPPRTRHTTVAEWGKYLHPDDAERSRAKIQAALAGASDYEDEQRLVGADGVLRWVHVKGTVVRDNTGNPLRIVGVCSDITERKRAKAELEQSLESERSARADAERASRLKDDFLATVSHELRTPLNAILGYAQLLRHGPSEPGFLTEGLEVIERNARAQTQIIEDILDMSRIVAGKLRLDVQRVTLQTVIEAAMATVRRAADAKGIRLVKTIDPLASPVSGDPGRLQQVVWNLLTNAIKFTPKGGRVQLLLERVNSHVELTISDNGQGINADFLPFVFDKFRQADASTSRKHGGLGLGLALVKHLIEMHGGSVRVKSPGEGQGATFTVSLPVSAVHAEAHGEDRVHPAAATQLGNAPDWPSLNGLSVLVVDDEPDARSLVRRLLEDCGATVITAASAREAIDVLDKQGVDVLVSDIGMPDEDGYDLIRQVRARGPAAQGNVPAAALTAFARSQDRTRALRAGYHTHIAKPVEPIELVFAVASLAGLSGKITRG